MIKHRRIAAAAIGLLSLTGLACGSRLDRDGSIDELVDLGFTRDAAECMIDEMVDEFGEDKVISDDQPTAEEAARITEITIACTSG